MFTSIQLESQATEEGQIENLTKLQLAIDDFFMQTTQSWTGERSPDGNKLELIIRQTFGIVLKSAKAAVYIEQLMELEDEHQETLGLIVQSCLGAIDDNNSSIGSSSNHSSSFVDIAGEMHAEEVIGTGRSVGDEEDNRERRNVPMLTLSGDIQVGLNSERHPQALISARTRNGPNTIDSNFKSSGKRLSGKMILKQLTMSRSSIVMTSSSMSHLPEEDKNNNEREHGRMTARLQRRMLLAEDELKQLRVKNSELDQNCIKLGSENQQLLNEINALNALKKDLSDKEKHINERIMEEMAKER